MIQLKERESFGIIDREVTNAIVAGAGFILQMDGNCHLGKEVIKKDVNDQNLNGTLFNEFLERNPHLSLVNSLPICEGVINRMAKLPEGFDNQHYRVHRLF